MLFVIAGIVVSDDLVAASVNAEVQRKGDLRYSTFVISFNENKAMHLRLSKRQRGAVCVKSEKRRLQKDLSSSACEKQHQMKR